MEKSQTYLQENYYPQNQLLILHLLKSSYYSAPFLAGAEKHHYSCLGNLRRPGIRRPTTLGPLGHRSRITRCCGGSPTGSSRYTRRATRRRHDPRNIRRRRLAVPNAT